MNSAASCSMRSAVSPTFLPTRVVVSSTLRLKSSITPQTLIREIPHTQPRHYFAPTTPGQSKLPIFSNFILSRRVTHLFVFSAKRVGGPTTRTYNRITTEYGIPRTPSRPAHLVRRKPPRPSLAQHPRSLPCLDLRNHAAANPRRRGHPALCLSP